MPSPVGHALGGIAAGCAISRSKCRREVLAFAAAGVIADVDLILSATHRGPTHSVVTAILVFLVAFTAFSSQRPRDANLRLAAAIGLAYFTHVLFDWLGEDSGPPSGIMAFWPFSTAYHVSGLDVFNGIERRYWLPEFWWGNARSVLREILIVGPLAWLAVKWSPRVVGGRQARPYS